MEIDIVLISESFEQDASGQWDEAETEITVAALLKSVNRAEFFKAGIEGLQPSFVAITPTVNYSGQKKARINGTDYAIYRTYLTGEGDEIELYLEEKAGVTYDESESE